MDARFLVRFNDKDQASCTRLVAENGFGGLEIALLEAIDENGEGSGNGNKRYDARVKSGEWS
jgi:hypothetical protein